MKRKIIISVLSIIFIFSLVFTACTPSVTPDPDKNYEDLYITMPESNTITPIAGAVDFPAAPTLPQYDETKSPYIGNVGTSTDFYQVAEIKDENDNIKGASVNYPQAVKPYHFVYFDIYNYSSRYSNIRIDFTDIVGAEKVAVSAFYIEQVGTENPNVGVLVETIMDGAMSFVTSLDNFKTVNKNFVETNEFLDTKTVARLYFYLDSNPAQKSTDNIGSLNIASITFLQDKDPLLNVDNSPKVGQIASTDSYTLTTTETDENFKSVFKVNYSSDALSEFDNVNVKINRYSAAYSLVNLSFISSNVNKLTITDGQNVLSGYDAATKQILSFADFSPQHHQSIVIDLRGSKTLNNLLFFIDNNSTKDGIAREFILLNVDFDYTPYATEAWSATSKFGIEGEAIGGKVKATYNKDVGYDFLSVPVKHWKPSYNLMTVTFKSSGLIAGPAERYGLSVNSNNVIREVEHSTIKDLPYNEQTGEYTMNIELDGIKKLSMLNFYFDSILVDFQGYRTVEITSINFFEVEPILKTSDMKEIDNRNFSITNNGQSSYNVSWDNKSDEWAYSYLIVSNYTSDFKYMHLTFNATNDVKIGVFQSNVNLSGETAVIAHTNYKAGLTETYISLESLNLDSSFSLKFFWDAAITGSSNSVDVQVNFVEEAPKQETTIQDMKQFEGVNVYDIVNTDIGESTVTWTNRTDVWAYSYIPVVNYTAEYRYLTLKFELDAPTKIGAYQTDANLNGDNAFFVHEVLPAGITERVFDLNNYTLGAGFNIRFFWDAGTPNSSGSAKVTVCLLTESPIKEPVLGNMRQFEDANVYDVVNTENGESTVTWTNRTDVWAYSYIPVVNYTAEYRYLTLTFELTAPTKIGVYQCDANLNDITPFFDHEVLPVGSTEKVIDLNNYSVDGTFNIKFFWDAGTPNSSGSVKVTATLSK